MSSRAPSAHQAHSRKIIIIKPLLSTVKWAEVLVEYIQTLIRNYRKCGGVGGGIVVGCVRELSHFNMGVGFHMHTMHIYTEAQYYYYIYTKYYKSIDYYTRLCILLRNVLLCVCVFFLLHSFVFMPLHLCTPHAFPIHSHVY